MAQFFLFFHSSILSLRLFSLSLTPILSLFLFSLCLFSLSLSDLVVFDFMGFVVVNGYRYVVLLWLCVVLLWIMRCFAMLWWAMIVVGSGAIRKKKKIE